MVSIPPQRRRVSPRRSHRLRPALEAVEARILLAAAAAGAPLLVATLGDSLTDEYSFYGPESATDLGIPPSLAGLVPANFNTIGRSSARNWVLNLATTRAAQVSFGSYTTANRNETRNQGFAEDWALSGATARGGNLDGTPTTFSEQLNGFPRQGLPGLLTQTTANSQHTPKDVNVVTILIGSNDYVRALAAYAQSLSLTDEFTRKTQGHANAVNTGIETSIRTALTQIHRKLPRAKVVIVTPPDITIAPVVDSVLAAGSTVLPGLSQTITRSVAALDTDLARLTRQKHVGVVNTQSLFEKFHKHPTIDGVTVNLQASGQELTDGFVGDGFHPGTILQGVLAQAITAKINTLEGKKIITPLSDADIVHYAIASQPALSLSAVIASDTGTTPNDLQLQAVVAPGLAGDPVPTGTVTFETLTPATATTPAAPGTVLGVATLDGTGVATLAVNASMLDLAPFYAVYSGDTTNNARLSAPAIPVFATTT